MAAGAVYGKLGWDEAHSEKKWKNPRVQELSKKVKLVGSSSQKLGPATVEVVTKNGSHHSITIKDIRMTQADVEEKFLDLATPVLGTEKSNRVVDTVNKLEKVKDVSRLGDVLQV